MYGNFIDAIRMSAEWAVDKLCPSGTDAQKKELSLTKSVLFLITKLSSFCQLQVQI